jgi:hypothetical protein
VRAGGRRWTKSVSHPLSPPPSLPPSDREREFKDRRWTTSGSGCATHASARRASLSCAASRPSPRPCSIGLLLSTCEQSTLLSLSTCAALHVCATHVCSGVWCAPCSPRRSVETVCVGEASVCCSPRSAPLLLSASVCRGCTLVGAASRVCRGRGSRHGHVAERVRAVCIDALHRCTAAALQHGWLRCITCVGFARIRALRI